jgi:hypothetical protein
MTTQCTINNTNNIQEGFMVIRHFILAGLAATASLAQAGVVEPGTAAGPTAAWSSAGSASQAAPANPLQVMLAGPGKWTGHSRMGDRSATSTMLFTQKTYGAPTQAAAVASPVQSEPMVAPAPAPVQAAAAAPAPAAALPPAALETPQADASIGAGADVVADTSGLINAGGLVNVGADVNVELDAVAPAAIPEPATGMLMLAGLLGAGALTRRRRK